MGPRREERPHGAALVLRCSRTESRFQTTIMKFIRNAIGVNLVGVVESTCVRIEHLYMMPGILSAESLYPSVALRHPGLGGL